MTLNDVIDKTIVEINTDNEPYIHYLAYGYYADDKRCILVEYTGFYVQMKDIFDFGSVYEYELEFGCDYKQYLTDMNDDKLFDCYTHYDNGNMPKIINEKDIDINTPSGVYIVIPGRNYSKEIYQCY